MLHLLLVNNFFAKYQSGTIRGTALPICCKAVKCKMIGKKLCNREHNIASNRKCINMLNFLLFFL